LRFCYSEYVPFSVGAEAGFNYLFFIGLGITAYGFYFMIHDVLIHQRFKWFKSTKNRYLIGLRKAQSTPQKMGKEGSEVLGCYMFPSSIITCSNKSEHHLLKNKLF
jgi:beta-carotene 3-hydroxylase